MWRTTLIRDLREALFKKVMTGNFYKTEDGNFQIEESLQVPSRIKLNPHHSMKLQNINEKKDLKNN